MPAAVFTAHHACAGKHGQKKSPAHKASAISFFAAQAAHEMSGNADPK
jgi:hypothetical protein